ncbi:MAG: hypothetical protein DRJ38_05640 [Thermoprotei archaeon]|nr:MAG: hypothetical protein DRJ38_05640 [Thermoprotei archaeon]
MLKKEKKNVESILVDNVFLAYEEISQTYRRGYVWVKLLSNIKNGSKLILDAGCGSGLHSLYLAERSFYVVALDISQGMVKRSVKTVYRRKLGSYIDGITGDMRYLPFRNNVFDYVVAIASIHHIPLHKERLRTIREFHRVLKNRGGLIVSVWSLLQPSLFLYAVKTWIMRKSFEFGDVFISWRTTRREVRRFFHLFTKEELKNLVTAQGIFKINRLYGWSPKKGLIARNFVAEAVKNGDS